MQTAIVESLALGKITLISDTISLNSRLMVFRRFVLNFLKKATMKNSWALFLCHYKLPGDAFRIVTR